MKDIRARIGERLRDEARIKRLLILEKARRGVGRDDLLFVAMSNVAHYYWCGLKAVLKSRQEEPLVFASYLEGRLLYAHRLGLIDKLPDSDEGLLSVGGEITFDEIQECLKARRVGNRPVIPVALKMTPETKKRVLIINPDLPPEERAQYEQAASAEALPIADSEQFPEVRGQFLESTHAEKYPTTRWYFVWGRYVVVGAPDGITDRFVYEFKSTGNPYRMRPIASAQADIYGYFFQRDYKRVQIYLMDKGTIETQEEKVSREQAERVLRDFSRVDQGWLPPAPMQDKCKNCEYRHGCPLRASLSNYAVQQSLL